MEHSQINKFINHCLLHNKNISIPINSNSNSTKPKNKSSPTIKLISPTLILSNLIPFSISQSMDGWSERLALGRRPVGVRCRRGAALVLPLVRNLIESVVPYVSRRERYSRSLQALHYRPRDSSAGQV